MLRPLNLSINIIDGALRISLEKFTSDVEIDIASNILIDTVRSIRKLM